MKSQLFIWGDELVIDLSPESGALIVYAKDRQEWRGAEVWLCRGTDLYDFGDVQRAPFAAQQIDGAMAFVAIFRDLASGQYRAFASGQHAQVTQVLVEAGSITEIYWASQKYIPNTTFANGVLRKHFRSIL